MYQQCHVSRTHAQGVNPTQNGAPETCMFQHISCMEATFMRFPCMFQDSLCMEYTFMHVSCMEATSMHFSCMKHA